MEEVAAQSNNQFYRRTWIQTIVPTALSSKPKCWIVFLDEVGLGKQISAQLKGAAHKVVEVKPGAKFAKLGRYEYTIRPNARPDYDALLDDLQRKGNPPDHVVHLWSVVSESTERTTEEILDTGFYSLRHLAHVVAVKKLPRVDISLISNQLQSISGENIVLPSRATALGMAETIPKEHPTITCRSIDCDPAGQGMSYVAVQIIAELCAPSGDKIIAYRGNRRWVERFEGLGAAGVTGGPKHNGVYVFSGAFGETELAMVEQLLGEFHASIALVGCAHRLPSGGWQAIQSNATMPDSIRKSVEKLADTQSSSGRILAVDAELNRPEDVRRGMHVVVDRFGRIDGLVYVSDEIGEDLRTTSSTGNVETSLVQAIEKTRSVSSVFGGQQADFRLFYPFQSLPTPPQSAINRAAMSEFLSSVSAMRTELPILCLACEMPGLNPTDRAKELFNLLRVDPAKGLTAFYGELPKESQPTGAIKNRPGPGSDIQSTLTKWWEELFESGPVGVDDDFFDLGGDSLIAARFIGMINKTYGLELGLSIMFEARTIRQIAEVILSTEDAKQTEPKPWSPVVPIQPKGKELPLYVISGVGGNVIKFHSLAFYLGEEQPVFGLLPRGLDGREPFISRLEDLATYYVDAIRTVQPTGPYRVAGYSFGGIVAFEVARQLVERGESIDLLVLFDTIEWNYGTKVLSALPVRERIEIYKEHADAILSTEDRVENFKRLLGEKIARLGYRLLSVFGRPIPQKLATIEDVSAFAAANYKPKVYPGKIVLFRSTKRGANEGDDEYLGWGDLATGGVDVNQVPATHFDILMEPAVKLLAGQLRAYLDPSRSQKTIQSELSRT